MVTTVLKDTSSTLSEIRDSSVDQQNSIHEFASNALNGIQSIRELDSSVEQIGDGIKSDAEDVTTHIAEHVLQNANMGVSMVMESGKEIASYCKNEVISSMKSSIENMEKPRHDIMTNFGQECETIRKEVENVTASIETSTSTITSLSDAMRDGVTNRETTFVENVADHHKIFITQQKEILSESVENYHNTTSVQLTASTNGASAAKGKIGTFSKDTLKMDEEVKSLMEKSSIKFSENLTSTPSESIIIQSMEQKRAKSNSVQNDENMRDNDHGDVNSSMESEASEYSTKSQQLVLQMRSPNRENVRPKLKKKKSQMLKKREGKSSTKRTVPKGGTPLRNTMKKVKR